VTRSKALPTIQLDNDQVRVTEWRFTPGAETGFHVHEMDYVVVPLMNGRLLLLDRDGNESHADLIVGKSYARQAGVAHNVVNAGDATLAFVEIELKSKT
jgi:quercetin dioxygenase-like cupin family protein